MVVQQTCKPTHSDDTRGIVTLEVACHCLIQSSTKWLSLAVCMGWLNITSFLYNDK